MEGGNKYKVMILFVWFLCFSINSSASALENEFESSLLRNYAVDAASASRFQFKSLLRNNAADYLKADLSFRISGPNGYCVQTRGGSMTVGVDVVLSPCGGILGIFTLDGSGRLKPFINGCLMTTGYTPGSSIFLHACNATSTTWEFQNDGQIVNPESGLVLTAVTGNLGTVLTLDIYIASSFQTWRTDSNTNPSLVSITGLLSNGLCIQATNNTKVLVSQCNTITNHEQRFLLYPDGTIRPALNTNGCLTYDNLINNTIIVLTCGLSTSSQRWLYTTTATILNPRSNLVMELFKEEIIVSSPAAENLNQRWIVMPI